MEGREDPVDLGSQRNPKKANCINKQHSKPFIMLPFWGRLKMAAAIPEWTSEQFPSKKAAISTMVARRLVAADSNSLWIWSSTRKLCEESGPALGRFCSVAVYKEVSKELIRREMSLCFNRRNWKPCCGRVISAKQLPQQNQLRLWEKEADKGLLIPVTTETSGWNWAECFPAHTLGLRESFSCFFSPHSSASSLPGLV